MIKCKYSNCYHSIISKCENCGHQISIEKLRELLKESYWEALYTLNTKTVFENMEQILIEKISKC
jgi:hypothetical protein